MTGLAAVILVPALACASGRGTGIPTQRNVVTHDELAATNNPRVYQALERLRPSWMTNRGPTSTGNVRDNSDAVANVYIDGNRMGDLEYLKEIYVADVEEIRFWSAGEAGARFGMGNPRGVIEVIPRR